jgi:hypothetical protein
MAMGPRTKNDCTDEGQQQFTKTETKRNTNSTKN